MAKKIKNQQPMTTAQQLSSIVKSCRDIMRKDKGLNGDLDRLPMLTWVMFLKFLDDMEMLHETEASLAGKRYKPIIEPPYRWRDWAAKEEGMTGDDLISFINNDEAKGPDGKRGPGLFAYLRSLQSANGADRRDVIASVFRGLNNRMLNGYLLKDILNKINGIHFTSSDEIHTISYLYESMLKEMRDAAGDSGEFYTPRPVIKFMVKVINPQLGETILDPACGTGGFLAESFEHLKSQCKKTEDLRRLQEETLYGIEAKSLPYLLCQMNLMLHGLEYPQIDPLNALRFPLNEIGDKDRVDIILTNPPFGGEEEKGIQNNFPDDMRTSETALLFLQFIMRKLKRNRGRAAVILPDGILSQEGIATRIREELVKKYNLHTIVRLPRGVFEPYTKSSTSILFFDSKLVTQYVWYYEIKVRPGIKAYTQNQPFLFEEFEPCIKWWANRFENDSAWRVSISDISQYRYSLSFKNPRTAYTGKIVTPDELSLKAKNSLEKVLDAIKVIHNRWEEIRNEIGNNKWPKESFDKLVKQVKREVLVNPDTEYPILAMSWYAKGLYIKHKKNGSEIQAKKLYRIRNGDFVYNRLFAWKGSFAEAGGEADGCYVSNEFPSFVIDHGKIAPGYLWAYFAQPEIWDYIESLSTGTTSTSRLRLKESKLRQFEIPIPPKPIQQKIASVWREVLQVEKHLKEFDGLLNHLAPAIFERIIPLQGRKYNAV